MVPVKLTQNEFGIKMFRAKFIIMTIRRQGLNLSGYNAEESIVDRSIGVAGNLPVHCSQFTLLIG